MAAADDSSNQPNSTAVTTTSATATATAQQGEEKKALDQQGQHLNLKVKAQDGNEVVFRVNRTTQLMMLMNAYCERQSVDVNSVAFLFNGRHLQGEQTPEELDMANGDEIDAMLHQTGGGHYYLAFHTLWDLKDINAIQLWQSL